MAIPPTPLGTRIVFVIAALIYVYLLCSPEDASRDLVCTPYRVLYEWKVLGLLTASLTHKSIVALAFAIVLCWRRFASLEYQMGSAGFLWWFLWTTVLYHASYCVCVYILSFVFDEVVMQGELHGLFPLAIVNLVSNMKETNDGNVHLWPLSLSIPLRFLPPIIVVIALFLNFEANALHLVQHGVIPLVIIYVLAGAFPVWLEPSGAMLESFMQNSIGSYVLKFLQGFESYVCPPPSGPFSASTSAVNHSDFLQVDKTCTYGQELPHAKPVYDDVDL